MSMGSSTKMGEYAYQPTLVVIKIVSYSSVQFLDGSKACC